MEEGGSECDVRSLWSVVKLSATAGRSGPHSTRDLIDAASISTLILGQRKTHGMKWSQHSRTVMKEYKIEKESVRGTTAQLALPAQFAAAGKSPISERLAHRHSA